MQFGTTVVCVILGHSAYIAADSRVHDNEGEPTGVDCKAIECNGIVAVAAGLLGDDAAGWNTLALARAELQRPGDARVRIRSAVEAVSKRLSSALGLMLREDRGLYLALAEHQPCVQLLFACVAQPVSVLQFTLEPVSKGTMVEIAQHVSAFDAVDEGAYVALGHFEKLNAHLAGTPRYWNERLVAEQLRTLVQLESMASPKTVGGDLSIVKVSSSGVTWIDRGVCK